MHPILMLVNKTFGSNVRRLASSFWTAGVLAVVLAVTVVLILSGAFSAGPVLADSALARSGTAVENSSAATGVANGGDGSEVRLENWEYTAKPISPAVVKTKKK